LFYPTAGVSDSSATTSSSCIGTVTPVFV
jgi:hypothetical protein